MSEPVRCGCGGEAEFTEIGSIRCRKCGIETAVHATDNDTTAYWDAAMGAKLREENDRLRKALEFYARASRYEMGDPHMGGGHDPSQMDHDAGAMARAALKGPQT